MKNYTLSFTLAKRLIRGLQNRYPYPYTIKLYTIVNNNYSQDPYPSFVACLEREIGRRSLSYRLLVRDPVGRVVTDCPFHRVHPTIWMLECALHPSHISAGSYETGVTGTFSRVSRR